MNDIEHYIALLLLFFQFLPGRILKTLAPPLFQIGMFVKSFYDNRAYNVYIAYGHTFASSAVTLSISSWVGSALVTIGKAKEQLMHQKQSKVKVTNSHIQPSWAFIFFAKPRSPSLDFTDRLLRCRNKRLASTLRVLEMKYLVYVRKVKFDESSTESRLHNLEFK